MRVALVTHVVRRGDGQGRVCLEIARAAVAEGIKMIVLASACDPDLARHPNVSWVPISVSGLPTELVRNQVFAAKTAIWLLRHRREYDLLHVNGWITWVRGDINTSHFVHSAWLQSPAHPVRQRPLSLRSLYQGLYTALNAWLEKGAYRSARVCVAVSDLVAEQLAGIGVPGERIVTIWNGVDLEEFSPGPACRKELGLPEDVPLALFVGDLKRNVKNLDTVLRALVLVPNWHLAVVGDTAGSPYPAMAVRLGLADRVHFLGYRRDLRHIYRAADTLLAPSRYDACPLVVFEAMASGLPVLTSSWNGAASLVRSAGGCVVNPPEDATQVSAWLLQMQAARTEADKMRTLKHTHRSVAEIYGWPRVADEYITLYRDLHASRHRRTTTPYTTATSPNPTQTSPLSSPRS